MNSIQTDTLPKLLLENYHKYGGKKIAMKRKALGIWNPYSWEDYYRNVKYFCLGLMSHGIEPGDKLAVLGDNAPEIYWAQLAVQAAGGTVVPLFADSISTEVKHILENSDSKFVVAEDQEQVDKILDIAEELPLLKKVVYWDPKGLRGYYHPLLTTFNAMMEKGQEYEATHPGVFEQQLDKGKADDLACIFYTSGTTGLPKGAMHTHRALISTSRRWFQFDPCQDSFEYLSMLPAAWGGEEYAGVVDQLLSGMCVDFPEEPETLQQNFREISPQTSFFGVRQLESIISEVELRILDANVLKRLAYRLFMPLGYKVAGMRLAKGKMGIFWKILYDIANLIIFRPIRDRFGFSKARWVYTGGTLVNPDILEFFHAIGVPVKPLYGLTESGVCVYHTEEIKTHTAGIPGPGIEVGISSEGEILLRSETMFKGYCKDPELTDRRVVDGWLHTGDAGYLDEDGHLIVVDRMDELMEVAGGKFSPQFIEVHLRYSPYIKDAVAIGGKERPYVTAMINIDYNSVGKWAEDHHIPYTTFTDLSQKVQVYDLIQKEVERVNRILPTRARIKKYFLLHKELDADDAELTRTRKLKRTLVETRFGFIIDAMYRDEIEVVAEAEVKYRDGRGGKVVTSIQVRALDVEI